MKGICPKCNERPTAGRSGYCRECKAAHNSAYRKDNRELIYSLRKAWLEKRPGYMNKYRSNRYKYDPIKRKIARRNHLLKSYGLTESQFNAMIEKQNFKCASCGDPTPTTLKAKIDHCHTTGIVRGLLCHNCNVSIGLMRDDPAKIKKLAAYLIRFQRRK